MNSKFFIALGIAVGSLTVTVKPSSAATFDFVAIASGNEHGALSETFTDGGVSVTATGRNLLNTVAYYEYLDDRLTSGEPGGLGVCKNNPGSGECVPGEDDNLSLGEVLELQFNTPVIVTNIEFSNGIHLDDYIGNFGVALDSTPTTVGGFTQFPQTAVFSGPLSGTKFSFISDSVISGVNTDQHIMYISKLTATPASVPEPMTLGLLGLGLAGAGLRRKAKRA